MTGENQFSCFRKSVSQLRTRTGVGYQSLLHRSNYDSIVATRRANPKAPQLTNWTLESLCHRSASKKSTETIERPQFDVSRPSVMMVLLIFFECVRISKIPKLPLMFSAHTVRIPFRTPHCPCWLQSFAPSSVRDDFAVPPREKSGRAGRNPTQSQPNQGPEATT